MLASGDVVFLAGLPHSRQEQKEVGMLTQKVEELSICWRMGWKGWELEGNFILETLNKALKATEAGR